MSQVCISSITHAETCYGLARRPEAKRLQLAVNEFLKCVRTMTFNETTAEYYGLLKSTSEKLGINLSAMNMLIAAHAKKAQM